MDGWRAWKGRSYYVVWKQKEENFMQRVLKWIKSWVHRPEPVPVLVKNRAERRREWRESWKKNGG